MDGIEKYYRREALEYSRVNSGDAELADPPSQNEVVLSAIMVMAALSSLLICGLRMIPRPIVTEIGCQNGVEIVNSSEGDLRSAIIYDDGKSMLVRLRKVSSPQASQMTSFEYSIEPFEPSLCKANHMSRSAVFLRD